MVEVIDVSAYSGAIDWKKLAAAGVKKAFMRSSWNTRMDAAFQHNWFESKAAGVKRGAYHFWHPEASNTKQLAAFSSIVGRLEHDDLDPVFDLEVLHHVSPAVVLQRAIEFASGVEQTFSRPPIVYTGPNFWKQDLGNPECQALGARKLWIAHYTPGAPMIPKPWKEYEYHQYAGNERMPGIAGYVDYNRERLPSVTEIQLRLLAIGYSVGPTLADGKFGPKTKAAVMAFQTKEGLVVDGIVGPKTRAALWR